MHWHTTLREIRVLDDSSEVDPQLDGIAQSRGNSEGVFRNTHEELADERSRGLTDIDW